MSDVEKWLLLISKLFFLLDKITKMVEIKKFRVVDTSMLEIAAENILNNKMQIRKAAKAYYLFE